MNNPSKPRLLLRSLLVSYLLSGILLLALTFLLYRLHLKEAQTNLLVYAVYGASCLTGGLLAGKGIASRRFFWGLLAGLLYFLILFAASWIMNHGSLPDCSRMLSVLVCCCAAGTIGGMMS